ncbi:hypothetical protein WG915_09875 [Corynebacterium sp. H128]|uniref:hypothetical protein n=1 Tax=unclassified Corynebacterium TaxID=2624378 RepID=UPI00309A1F71
MTTFMTREAVACTAVLAIDELPRRLRPVVEELMVDCIPSPPGLDIPGADPLTVDWFTRWERSASSPAKVGTRQVITGHSHEIEDLGTALEQLRQTWGFELRLSIVD